jgi:hypothetical protein
MQEVLEYSGYPLKNDTVPGWVLMTFVWIIPVATVIVSALLRVITPWQAHQRSISFLIAYLFTGVATNVIKLQVCILVRKTEPDGIPLRLGSLFGWDSSSAVRPAQTCSIVIGHVNSNNTSYMTPVAY